MIALRAVQRDASQWFILGVAIGFAGSVFDNLYWGIAWLSNYLAWESWPQWFACGVYSNVVFRQTAGLVAAYCHIRSAIEYSNRHSGTVCRQVMLLSVVLAVVAAWLLVLYMPGYQMREEISAGRAAAVED